jgi:hypothetical protein
MMTLNVYARPTEDGDRAAARQLGAYFLGPANDPAVTRDGPIRTMTPELAREPLTRDFREWG